MVSLERVNTHNRTSFPCVYIPLDAPELRSFCFAVIYLFVGLGEHDPHPFHRQAGVAQRTGLAAVPRRGVDALHSRETGVKLALRRGGRATCTRLNPCLKSSKWGKNICFVYLIQFNSIQLYLYCSCHNQEPLQAGNMGSKNSSMINASLLRTRPDAIR